MSRNAVQIVFYLLVGVPLTVALMWALKQVPDLGLNNYFTNLTAILIAIPTTHWMRSKVFGPLPPDRDK